MLLDLSVVYVFVLTAHLAMPIIIASLLLAPASYLLVIGYY